MAAGFASDAPVRLVGGALIVTALGLAAVWLATWALYVFAARPTPVEPDAFKVVAALDLTLMVPALLVGEVSICTRRPWGYVIATIATVQATLYLLVLSVNSLVLIGHGLSHPPGELPIWGPLTLLLATLATVLLRYSTPRASGAAACRRA